MKMNKKMMYGVMMMLMAALLCCGCVAGEQRESGTLALSHTVLQLPLEGVKGQLRAIGAGEGARLEWFTEDSSVALVRDGLVTPVGAGSTVITCTDGSQSASCLVTVGGTMDLDYELRQSAARLTLAVGDAGTVEYIYTGSGNVAVLSSDPGVLAVENGRYRAVSAGTAVLTCSDGLKTAQCLVTVTAPGR